MSSPVFRPDQYSIISRVLITSRSLNGYTIGAPLRDSDLAIAVEWLSSPAPPSLLASIWVGIVSSISPDWEMQGRLEVVLEDRKRDRGKRWLTVAHFAYDNTRYYGNNKVYK